MWHKNMMIAGEEKLNLSRRESRVEGESEEMLLEIFPWAIGEGLRGPPVKESREGVLFNLF